MKNLTTLVNEQFNEQYFIYGFIFSFTFQLLACFTWTFLFFPIQHFMFTLFSMA